MRVCRRCEGEFEPPDIGERGLVCFACQRAHKAEYDKARMQDPKAREHAQAQRRAKRQHDYVHDPERYEAHLQYMREWRRKHPDAQKGYSKRYRDNRSPEQIAERKRYDRERMARRRAENPEAIREAERGYRDRLNADPRRKAARNEAARLNYRLRREREGKPPRPLSVKTYNERYGYDYGRRAKLPAEPLRNLLIRTMRQMSRAEIERRTGVPERRYFALLDGQRTVTVSTADRLCVGLNVPLTMIYPEAR